MIETKSTTEATLVKGEALHVVGSDARRMSMMQVTDEIPLQMDVDGIKEQAMDDLRGEAKQESEIITKITSTVQCKEGHYKAYLSAIHSAQTAEVVERLLLEMQVELEKVSDLSGWLRTMAAYTKSSRAKPKWIPSDGFPPKTKARLETLANQNILTVQKSVRTQLTEGLRKLKALNDEEQLVVMQSAQAKAQGVIPGAAADQSAFGDELGQKIIPMGRQGLRLENWQGTVQKINEDLVILQTTIRDLADKQAPAEGAKNQKKKRGQEGSNLLTFNAYGPAQKWVDNKDEKMARAKSMLINTAVTTYKVKATTCNTQQKYVRFDFEVLEQVATQTYMKDAVKKKALNDADDEQARHRLLRKWTSKDLADKCKKDNAFCLHWTTLKPTTRGGMKFLGIKKK